MLFPTGYSTNIGLIQGLMRPGDLIVADQNSHASIVDGAILSKAEVRLIPYGAKGPLRWRELNTCGAMTPAGKSGEDAVEFIVPMSRRGP